MDDLIIEARRLCYRYSGIALPAVQDLSMELRRGELVGVVGPNGSGKTTLLRLLLGVLPLDAGEVRIEGRTLAQWDRRELARSVGVVVQREEPAFPLRVRQAVLLGRYPHMRALAAPGEEDRRAVTDALRRCDAAALADRWISTLSGGEWQRVRVARALAQMPRALMLDEATASLDIRHEMEVFELVSSLVRQGDIGALVVTHHVNLAARFVDRIIVMDGGRAVAAGLPGDVMTREVLEPVFQWPVATLEFDGVPQVVPLRQPRPTNHEPGGR
jgi:iron complex transport system ATP-binding protein